MLSTRTLLLALGGQSLLAFAAEQDTANGFIEDSQWNLLNRSVYDRRDYRHGALSNGARNAYKPRSQRSDLAEEWAYGLMADYASGFTTGTLGFGLDAHVIPPGNWTVAVGAPGRHGYWRWTMTANPRSSSAAVAQLPNCAFPQPNCATASSG